MAGKNKNYSGQWKNNLTIFLLLISVMNLKAQDKNFRFGLRASPNLSWIKPDTKNFERKSMGLGFSYGVMADFKIGNSNNYAFGTEVLVSTLRSTVNIQNIVAKGPTVLANTEYTYKMQYIQLPLTLKLKTNEIGYITYFGQFGFAPSVLLKARADVSPEIFSPANQNTDRFVNEEKNDFVDGTDFSEDNIKSIRLPLVLGAGFEYNLTGSTSLVTGLRFDNGFTNIFTAKNTKGISNYLAVMVGLFF